MSSHARRKVFQEGTSDQDVPSLKQDRERVLILANGKSLVNSELMLGLAFCPKVPSMGVFSILEKGKHEDGEKKGYEHMAERTLGKLL